MLEVSAGLYLSIGFALGLINAGIQFKRDKPWKAIIALPFWVVAWFPMIFIYIGIAWQEHDEHIEETRKDINRIKERINSR